MENDSLLIFGVKSKTRGACPEITDITQTQEFRLNELTMQVKDLKTPVLLCTVFCINLLFLTSVIQNALRSSSVLWHFFLHIAF